MNPPLQFTPASPDDVDWAARLMASSEPWLTFKRELKHCHSYFRTPGRDLFIAREGDKRLGFLLLAANGFASSPYIASIAVHADARGKGVGTAMLNFAEQHFAGRKHLFLLVSSFNTRAQKLYKKHGYEFIGTLKGYIVPQHDELIFYKKITEYSRPQ